MNSSKRILVVLILCFASVFAGPAHASTIDYIFSGTFDGTLGSFATFTGASFTIDLTSDTSNITFSGGEYFNPASSVSFIAGPDSGFLSTDVITSNETVLNPSTNTVIFGQNQKSPIDFVAEGATDPSLGSYDLATAFPLIAGAVSQKQGSSFRTSLGDLVFSNISSITFEAVTSSPSPTPLPDALPLFAAALIALGVLAWDRKRKVARANAK